MTIFDNWYFFALFVFLSLFSLENLDCHIYFRKHCISLIMPQNINLYHFIIIHIFSRRAMVTGHIHYVYSNIMALHIQANAINKFYTYTYALRHNKIELKTLFLLF